ncbi:MAG: hypothetical protein AAB289_03190 [Chloroflexota bacterium]
MSLEYLEASLTDFERAVHVVLDDWFRAIESGGADQRLPDPRYERPEGKPLWTDEQLERLVAVAIDDYVDRQRSWMRNNRNIATDAHCGFGRLGSLQRLALAQDLEAVCVRYDIETGEAAPISAHTTSYVG